MFYFFKKPRSKAFGVLYFMMIAFVAWQAIRIITVVRRSSSDSTSDNCLVTVTGNVVRPGTYRVAPGLTHFEILKVAGIRPTSDISGFDLTGQISGDQQMEVGTMPNPVTAKKAGTVNLEFFMGQVGVIAADGKSRIVEEGLEIAEGDRMLTEEKAQAEISINEFSRVDIDEYSEYVIDKINGEEKGKKTTSVFLKSGSCWNKIVYANKSEVFKAATPFATVTVAGTGADFLVVVKEDEIDVHDIDGLLLVERATGSEAINMISGQSAVIFRDNRPFQVTQLAAEVNPADRFSMLTRAKTDFVLRHMPLQFLLCAVPGVYYLFSVQFEAGKVHAVHIPGSTSIEELVKGCSTLDQAFLYGGAVFVSTLIEQIMNSRIPKYLVLTKDDVVRIAGAVGGINANVDEKAAAAMRIPRGVQKLNNVQLVKFLNPGLSGVKDFELRQMQTIRAIFEGFRSRNIILTALLAEQLISSMETNFTASEIMSNYTKFSETKNWTFIEHELPLKQVVQNRRYRNEPNLEECKTLLQK